MSEVIRFTPPPNIARELDAISELGIYKNKNDFILDAITITWTNVPGLFL